ncbi:DUF6192 family protein [Kitasatospora purpeofusca]|uniref:DUF6192 family protein n=1 Tax=Kitasatospora purpeofusca TaxID=67352 RepID=UPI003863B505
MADDTARHQVNHAQVERGRQARAHFEGPPTLPTDASHSPQTAAEPTPPQNSRTTHPAPTPAPEAEHTYEQQHRSQRS